MRYLKLAVLLLFLFGVFVNQSFAETGTEIFSKGLLFKIEKPEYPQSFIFGTIHSGDSRVLDISEPVKAALAGADQYVMEVVLDGSSILSSIGNLWIPGGEKLSDVIGESLYQQVIDTAGVAGLPRETFTYMKPWVVMIMFSLPPGNYDNILDVSLMKMALKQNKNISGLETAQEQFEVFDGMAVEDQAVLLKNTLKYYPNLTKQFESLLLAYLEKDLEKLTIIGHSQVEAKEQALFDRMMKRLVNDRNERMVSRLLPKLQSTSNFVAVGALHLPGEDGLLNLLNKQGFTVTRIE